MFKSNSTHSYERTSEDVEISVVPELVPDRSNFEDLYYFKYTVSISNHRDKDIQVLSRHWIIRSGDGLTEEVEGDGVVGEQPVISPGETYSYESYCPLPVPTGNMRGSYFAKDQDGESLVLKIPLFFLRAESPDSSVSRLFH